MRAGPLADVVRRLRGASARVEGRPQVIAIDGRGGGGKTTLVERLHAAVPDSAVLGTDDIAWHHACFDWGELWVDLPVDVRRLPACSTHVDQRSRRRDGSR